MISRDYLPNIAIPRNRDETAIGVLDLLDYMPVGRKREAGVHDYVSLAAPRLAGSVGCGPLGRGVRQDAFRARGEGFEHASPGFEIVDDGAQFEDGSTLWCAAEIQPAPDGGGIEAAFRLSKGEHLKAALTWLRPLHDPRTSVDTAFHATCAFFGLSIIACSGEGRRFSEFLSKRCLRPGRGNAHHVRPR